MDKEGHLKGLLSDVVGDELLDFDEMDGLTTVVGHVRRKHRFIVISQISVLTVLVGMVGWISFQSVFIDGNQMEVDVVENLSLELSEVVRTKSFEQVSASRYELVIVENDNRVSLADVQYLVASLGDAGGGYYYEDGKIVVWFANDVAKSG